MQPLIDQTVTAPGTLARLLPVFVALAAGLILLGTAFFPEAQAAVLTWNASTAYGHCYLVLPMALYLIWDRREYLASVPVRPAPGFALLGLPIAAGWLVAERMGVMEGRQLLAMAGFELLFLAVLGWQMFRAVLGPLLFLFFMVPFGAFVTPALQHFTARFTEIGLNTLGIPNYTDDLIIEIPSGLFYVAEACAGLRFLIAAVAFGVFYALLNYRSPARRVAFIAASIVVPIIANGFRALGIVLLGHLLGSAEAVAADHVLYGWVFFSMVMLLLIAAGLPLRESKLPPRPALVEPVSATGPAPIWGALAVCALLACGPAAARALQIRASSAPLAAAPNLVLPPGCSEVGREPAVPTTRIQIAVQCPDHRLVAVVQSFPVRSTAAAMVAERRHIAGELGAEDVEVSPLRQSGTANGVWTLVQTAEPYRTTASAIWIGGEPSTGGLQARVALARTSLLGGRFAPVLMTISVDEAARAPMARRRLVAEQLRAFVDAQRELTSQIATLARRD